MPEYGVSKLGAATEYPDITFALFVFHRDAQKNPLTHAKAQRRKGFLALRLCAFA
jgi:hypothetical protein